MSQNENEENWNKLFQLQKSKETESNLIEETEKISKYFFLFDCLANKIIFVNTAFTTITGHQQDQFDIDFLINMIHPDDQPYFYSSEQRGVEFTNQLHFNEHFNFTLSYTYRVKTITGDYIYIRQECLAIEVNNSGHLTKTLVFHKKIEPYKTRELDDYRVFDRGRNVYIDLENRYNLSKREQEILDLIKDGNNSQQIADILKISKNTILTHRKNILSKTHSNSFIELIKKMSMKK